VVNLWQFQTGKETARGAVAQLTATVLHSPRSAFTNELFISKAGGKGLIPEHEPDDQARRSAGED
jgi:hypothetical protein